MNLRNGTKFGPATMIDGMQKDGLVDAYDNNAMGVCADLCAAEYNFLEKTKISTQFNRMSVQRKLGKQVNLITK
jgi:acetyl-CoA acetyltransferase